jgi:hypothetical protein
MSWPRARHADADGYSAATSGAYLHHAAPDAFGDMGRAVQVRVGKHDHEFFSAIAGREIGRTFQLIADAGGNRL